MPAPAREARPSGTGASDRTPGLTARTARAAVQSANRKAGSAHAGSTPAESLTETRQPYGTACVSMRQISGKERKLENLEKPRSTGGALGTVRHISSIFSLYWTLRGRPAFGLCACHTAARRGRRPTWPLLQNFFLVELRDRLTNGRSAACGAWRYTPDPHGLRSGGKTWFPPSRSENFRGREKTFPPETKEHQFIRRRKHRKTKPIQRRPDQGKLQSDAAMKTPKANGAV